MKYEICVLAPDNIVEEQARSLQSAIRMPFSVVRSNVDDCIAVARSIMDQGIRVVISRGSIVARLRASGLEIAVIEITVAGYDLIETMRRAREHDTRVALVGFDNVLVGADKIAAALDMELFTARVTSVADSARGVEKAHTAGFRTIIGGLRVTERAEALGMKAFPIAANIDNVRDALMEAERMVQVLRTQRESDARLAVTLDSIRDAIIAFDAEGTVIFFNSQADRYFRLSSSGSRPGDTFIVASGLREAVRRGNAWNGEVVAWKGAHYACTLNPVVSDMRGIGWVAVLQTGSHVQSLEHKMRHTLHSRGHVATYALKDIVHVSPLTETLVRTAAFYAQSPSTILVEGESGTGKELFAQGIHNASARRGGPFVAVNCAAIPPSLMESELFGYVEGAFTGARKGGKPGLFELAHQGTLFMDEIGDMPLALQSSLLRVLEEKNVMRIGQGVNIPVDVRVICAVNKDLFQMVQRGTFRSDLYYRLNVLRLRLPPLRDRPEDIRALLDHFLDILPPALDRARPLLDADAVEALLAYPFPGNVRELRNLVERMVVTCGHGRITAGDVTAHLHNASAMGRAPAAKTASAPSASRGLLAREARALIERTLLETNGNKAETARRLGISQATLWRRLRSFS